MLKKVYCRYEVLGLAWNRVKLSYVSLYITTADLKKATSDDTSDVAKKTDLVDLKPDLDK